MFQYETTLKSDAFGKIEKGLFIDGEDQTPAIRRVYTNNIFLKPLALFLANNEKKALCRLMPLNSPYFPKLLSVYKNSHIRSYIAGESMHRAQ